MANSNRARRIQKELADIQSDQHSRISVQPAGDGSDMFHLKGKFTGPPETPYEGGQYSVDIQIPNEYPFRPPIMKFDTKLWHPNVSSQTGAICLDTLKEAWSPVLTIKSALLSLQSLLSTPEPKDPQDAEVASMLMRNPQEFNRKATEWAVNYANAPERDVGEPSSRSSGQTQKQRDEKAKQESEAERLAQFRGYNPALVDRFCAMGFDREQVVSAFEFVGIDQNGGEDYELEEAYMGDVTARLFNEA